MKIVEYNNVDPLSVLHLIMLALDFPVTPEHAAYIRSTDPRPFPCLAVYAGEDEMVIGQVGLFRLPMISTEGMEDVGGVWAVSTHPNYAGRGVAIRLLEEAHTRMRPAGLRAQPPGPEGFDFVERTFANIASSYLGFALRHTPSSAIVSLIFQYQILRRW